MSYKDFKRTECPECKQMIGSQGLRLHRLIRHNVFEEKQKKNSLSV